VKIVNIMMLTFSAGRGRKAYDKNTDLSGVRLPAMRVEVDTARRHSAAVSRLLFVEVADATGGTTREEEEMRNPKLKELIDWTKFPIRRCYSLHECDICHQDIVYRARYYDGGARGHAHKDCVLRAILEEPAHDQP
jgi:hypothetical protein